MAENLLSCPFCSAEAHLRAIGPDFAAGCGTCGAEAGWAATEELAAAAWNRRAAPSQPFPPRVLAVIEDIASRTPPEHYGVYHDDEGPMQDVADEALAWISARELAAPSQPEGAEPTWPKLTKPAKVGAGTFGVGVSARLVVESAQRHYEWAQDERDNPKTPEQRLEAEMSRRRLWDMLNGVKEIGAAASKRCEYCDDTGDVHSIDGEWRGRCTCAAGAAAPDEGEVRQKALEEAAAECDRLTWAIDGAGNRYRREASASDCARAIRSRAALPAPKGEEPS